MLMYTMIHNYQTNSTLILKNINIATLMEQSTTIMQAAWQNVPYINPIEDSSILIIHHYRNYWIIFTIYTEKNFGNNAWNLEHMAIVNARELATYATAS